MQPFSPCPAGRCGTATLEEFVVDCESVAAARVSREGRILEGNAALERLVAAARTAQELFVTPQPTGVADLLADAGATWRHVHGALVRAGGELLDCKIWAVAHDDDHVLVLVDQLHAPREKLSALLLDLNDDLLRARRELAAQNDRLRRLDELKNMFIASATHDLQQPLTSMLGYAEMLGEQELPSQAQEMTLLIQRNARRMGGMIKDLLGAATIMTGDLALQRGPVDLRGLVGQAVDAIRPAAQAAGVELAVDGVEVAEAWADEARVLQILDNLLSNAVKYSPGGRVGVTCEVETDTVAVRVSDTGIGIPPAEQDRLFDRYFRASTAVSSGIPGTGLGLANARAFAEAHGGTLTCTSGHGGSTFTLVLPIGSAETTDPA